MAAVCVYCSSSEQIDVRLRRARGRASALASPAAGHSLVSGGGRVSMMGAVAKAARAGGAHTVGVIPEHLVPYEVADTDADELVVVETMRERKRIMDERSRRVPRAARRHRHARGAVRGVDGAVARHARQAGDRARPGRVLRAAVELPGHLARDRDSCGRPRSSRWPRTTTVAANWPRCRRPDRRRRHARAVVAGSPSAARSRARPGLRLAVEVAKHLLEHPHARPRTVRRSAPASSRATRFGVAAARGAVQQAELGGLGHPTTRPVKTRSLARDTPISGASRAGPTGTPSRAPAQASLRLSPPTRRSQPAAISAPAPTQLPTQTAIVGAGNASIAAYSRQNAAIRATPPSWSSVSPTSAPAQNARALVVDRTSTRSSASRGQLVERGRAVGERRRVERVALVGAVQPNDLDAGAGPVAQRRFGHAASPSRRSIAVAANCEQRCSGQAAAADRRRAVAADRRGHVEHPARREHVVRAEHARAVPAETAVAASVPSSGRPRAGRASRR